MDTVPLESDTITLPRSVLRDNAIWAALDIGSTLLKLAFVDRDEASTRGDVKFYTKIFHNKDMASVLQLIQNRVHLPKENRKLKSTGVGFGFHKEHIEKTLNVELVYVDEFLGVLHAGQTLMNLKAEEDIFYPMPPSAKSYTVDHAPWIKPETKRMHARMVVNDHQDHKPPMNFLNFGSGIIAFHVEADGKIVPKSIPLGGGLPFLGISKLLLGSSNYDEIMSLAGKGDVSKCYWLMKDCVPEGGEYGGNDLDLPLFPFGRLYHEPDREYSKEDVAACLVSFFAHIAHTVALHVSESTGISRFYVSGNWTRSETARRYMAEQRSVMHPTVIDYKFFKCSMLSVLGILLLDDDLSH